MFQIRVLQGENETDNAEYCHELANMQISGIPPGPAGSEKFTCTFKIDSNGILHVSAASISDSANGATVAELTVSEESMRMTTEEITSAT